MQSDRTVKNEREEGKKAKRIWRDNNWKENHKDSLNYLNVQIFSKSL